MSQFGIAQVIKRRLHTAFHELDCAGLFTAIPQVVPLRAGMHHHANGLFAKWVDTDAVRSTDEHAAMSILGIDLRGPPDLRRWKVSDCPPNTLDQPGPNLIDVIELANISPRASCLPARSYSDSTRQVVHDVSRPGLRVGPRQVIQWEELTFRSLPSQRSRRRTVSLRVHIHRDTTIACFWLCRQNAAVRICHDEFSTFGSMSFRQVG